MWAPPLLSQHSPVLRDVAGAIALLTDDGRPVGVSGFGSPEHSPVGIGLAALSLVVMPWLSWAQRRTGRELGSASAVADSKQTLLCTYLSAVVLLGLVLNTLFGWRWADPAAGLVIAVIAIKEARSAWRGEGCCAPAATPSDAGSTCTCCSSSLSSPTGGSCWS